VYQGSDKQCRCVQAPVSSSSLHSWNSFVLYSLNEFFIWHGRATTQVEKDHSITIANSLKRFKEEATITELNEGSESEKFWELLGGQKPYFSCPESHIIQKPLLKFFEVSSVTGAVDVEPIFDCCQDSLNDQKVMIIDAGDAIWVWFGVGARILEEKLSLDLAIKYSSKASHLPQNCLLYLTKAYQEPSSFKHLFHVWTEPKRPLTLRHITGEVQRDAREAFKDYVQEMYTYEQLTAKVLPKGVDGTKKESYLSDEEFGTIFGMSKDEYSKRPKWKRDELKKQFKLY